MKNVDWNPVGPSSRLLPPGHRSGSICRCAQLRLIGPSHESNSVYARSNSQNGHRFTTAFIAEYEPASRVADVCECGAQSRGSGAIETLDAGGLPLGIMDGCPNQTAAVTLQPGDLLAAFTDGLQRICRFGAAT